MSNAQDFVTSFMKNLAGEGVELTPSLQAVFAKILTAQVVVDADTNVVSFKPVFSTLLKVLTFIATPEADRTEAGSSYTQEAIDAAAGIAATETGLTVGEEIPTEEPTDEPTDGPTDEPTDEPTDGPTDEPTEEPTDGPTDEPTEEPGVEGETFSLTTGADVIVGTENDDVINGLAGSYSTKTLQDTDQIDGGAGHDTLNVELTHKFNGFKGDGFLKNVEVVNLTSESGSNRAFEAKQVTGVETYNLDGLVDLANLDSATIAVNAANRDKGTLKIGYATDVTKGPADVLNLGVTNLGAAATKVGSKVIAEERITVEAAGIETLHLNAAGDNFVNLSGVADAKALNIAGAGSIKLTDLAKTITNVDASALEGDLDLSLVTAEGVISVKSGAGDDLITAGAASLTISSEVNGGEGNDTLQLNNLAGTYQLQMDGVETIHLADVSGNLTYSAAKTAGLENLVVEGGISGDAVFAGMEGDINVTLNDASGSEISSDHDGATTLKIKSDAGIKAAAAAADGKGFGSALTTSVSATKSIELNATVDAHTDYSGSITAGSAESASLTLNGKVTGSTLALAEAQSLVINDNNKDVDTLILQADKLEELTVNVAQAIKADLASGDFTLTAPTSSLKGLKSLNVTSNGKFESTTALGEVSELNLMGAGAIKLGALGDKKAEDSINITAVGLAGNKAATTPIAGLETGAIATSASNSIDINVAEVLGSVYVSGDISVEDNATTGKKSGTITIEADGLMGNIAVSGSITAEEVNFNAADALGNVTNAADAATAISSVSGGESVTIIADKVDFIGSGLGFNSVKVTAEKATIVGGIKADYITVNAVAGTVKTTAELTGGLGADVFDIVGTGITGTGQMVVTITDFAAGEDKIATLTGASFKTGIDGLISVSNLTTASGSAKGTQTNFTLTNSATGVFSAADAFVNNAGANAGKVEFNKGAETAFFAAFNAFEGVSGLSATNTQLATVNISGKSAASAAADFALGILDNQGNFYTFNNVATAASSVLVKLVGVEVIDSLDFAVSATAFT